MERKRHQQHGYTLLELLVVLALIGLVTAIATPMAGRIVEGAELRADVRGLAISLARIQREAVAQEKTMTIMLHDGAPITSEGETLALTHASNAVFASDDVRLAYYPDGTSSGAVIRVGEGERTLDLEIAWLTGAIHVRETAP